MDEIKRQIEQLFRSRGIDELSISTLPEIMDEIMWIFDRETTAAFQRGVNAHLADVRALEE